MCGRFTLSYKASELQLSLGLKDVPEEIVPRYNIAPSQPIAAVLDSQKRNIEFLYWGLVPSWAKDIKIGSRLINARAETIDEKPSFRAAFKRRRCAILADGFYEWKKTANKSMPTIPYYFHLEDKRPFAFAGIWEIWHSPDGGELWSASIITTAANEVVEPIHHRMPVILDGDAIWDWMNESNLRDVKKMLKPYQNTDLQVYAVDFLVNNAKIDSRACLTPFQDRLL